MLVHHASPPPPVHYRTPPRYHGGAVAQHVIQPCRRLRRRSGIVVAMAWLVLGCAGDARPESLPAGLSPTDWREDLKELARELPRRHASAFHAVSQAQFDSAVASLDRALRGMGDDSAVVGFRRVVALIGDGHTNLSSPANWPRLPLRFAWFRGAAPDTAYLGLWVTHAGAGYDIALGTRVLAVGDSSTASALALLRTIISGGETEGSTRAASAAYLRSPHLLHGLGLTPTVDSVRLRLADTAGREFTLWVRPAPPTAPTQWRAAAAVEPLYLARGDDPYWFERLPGSHGDSSVMYLALGGYPDYFDFWRRTRALFASMDAHAADTQAAARLIIDLRDNAGGDFNTVRRLLIPGLRARSNVSSPGRLYVLTGPVTFSAGMTTAADLRRELGAILVGEPTGARPNQYQEHGEFVLPRSRLVVSVATAYYRFQDQDTPGVLPDHFVAPTWDEYRRGNDPALTWARTGSTRAAAAAPLGLRRE